MPHEDTIIGDPHDPSSEAARLAALYALDLLDTAPEREFDSIVALAATLLDTPFAAITLVDRERVWIKSGHGIPMGEERRELSFCSWAIGSEDVLSIADAERDARVRQRAAHSGAHDVRFYAGAPLHAPDGQRIGALCVADRDPRTVDAGQEARLRDLAGLVDALIAARAATREAIRVAADSARQAEQLRRQERVMHQAERLAMMGSWRFTIADGSLHWSENIFRIYGLPQGEAPGLDRSLSFFPPHARAAMTEALARLIETGENIDVESDFVTAQGATRRVRSIGELEVAGGRPVAAVGVFQDVTERWTMEEALRRSADRDELTGIANRAAFNRELDAAIADSRRCSRPLMVALIDLDGFKSVNDTFGHLAGDDVLKAVGMRLTQPWLAGSFAARLGGDEFALIVREPALIVGADGFVARLECELARPVAGAGAAVPCAGTVGVATLRGGKDEARGLIHRADTMLYAGKSRRRGERRIRALPAQIS